MPNDHYQRLWQQIKENFELDSAAVLIVEALYVAATQNKAPAVADYLDEQLSGGTLTLLSLRRHFQLLTGTQMPTVSVKQHDLSTYDQLLSPVHLINDLETPANDTPKSIESKASSEPVPRPQRPSQKPSPLAYAQPLGAARTSGYARAVVVRPIFAQSLRIGGGQTLVPPNKAGLKGSTPPWHQNAFQLRLDAYT